MAETKIENSKSNFFALLETILFVCTIVIIVLRATSSEPPVTTSSPIQGKLNDTVYSLCLSGILIFSFLIWFIARIFQPKSVFKFPAAPIGLILLATGIIIATYYAANKRIAVTSAITLIAPALMAIMLANILNSVVKIKILLIAIVSLGIVATVQCMGQFFLANSMLIEQYQNDPDSILGPLGIERNSFNHILLEHRILSKDVRGAFTTGNSAGSFAILTSFAALALAAELFKIRKLFTRLSGNRGLAFLILAFIVFGLFLTHSKGAIFAFLLALVLFGLLLQTKRPRFLKNIFLIFSLAVIIIAAAGASWYGMKAGKLPGGNSMLVRWQYWDASVKMLLDHNIRGIGGGNFSYYYPQYKTASAPETVSDPHSFILSILTQYGPIALIGFLVFIIIPLWRSALAEPQGLEGPNDQKFVKLAIITAAASAITLLIIRPFIIPPSTAITDDEKVYAFFSSYISTAAWFAVGIALLVKMMQSTAQKEYNLQITGLTSIALFCGLFGFVTQNLIDFAIFEPGILTAFFAMIACLTALNPVSKENTVTAATAPVWIKVPAIACVIIIVYGYFSYVLIPVYKTTALIPKARMAMLLGQVQLAHSYLDTAAKIDPLSPEAAALNGRLYLQTFYSPAAHNTETLNYAEQALFTAAQRNRQDYKTFNSLAQLYTLYANLQPEQEDEWLNKALNSALIAVDLYPGDAELHLNLAQIAEQLSQNDLALKNYKDAAAIEDAFRKQFQLMYPGRKVLSRISEDKYYTALQRIRDLEMAEKPK